MPPAWWPQLSLFKHVVLTVRKYGNGSALALSKGIVLEQGTRNMHLSAYTVTLVTRYTQQVFPALSFLHVAPTKVHLYRDHS